MRIFNGDYSTKTLFRLAIVIVAGLMLVFTGINEKIVMSKTPVNIYEVEDWSTLKSGDHVAFELKMVWDEFYTETTEHKIFGIKTSERETARGYLIPQIHYDSDKGEFDLNRLIGTKLSDYDTFEQMIAETNEWYEDWIDPRANPYDYCKTTYKIDGKLRKMSKEEESLMISYLVDRGLSESDANLFIVPVMIEPVKDAGISIIAGIIIFVVAAGIMFSHKKKQLKKDNINLKSDK